ncbi:hypothetical protein PIROE2DRAFT_15307 [Piromyces sp. E2]|nr:hypothetical protein PIROE2DRAFT_15307 [Piromyces sp. E2]|eukprot:OUM59216.1 hypothetical protein PIROE2DRAFT_15307 [Piromyces sp. E2]
MKLYNSLDEKYKNRITPYDYLDSIINKMELWKNIKLEYKEFNLTEIMDSVEFYDKINNKNNYPTTSNNGYNGNNFLQKFCNEKGHSTSECAGCKDAFYQNRLQNLQ